VHRRLERQHDLAGILSVVEARVVTNDYTPRYKGKIYQIARADLRSGLRGSRVRVEKRQGGIVAVKFRHRYLTVSVCDSTERGPPKPPPHSTPIATNRAPDRVRRRALRR
jgi:hypothetical protein